MRFLSGKPVTRGERDPLVADLTAISVMHRHYDWKRDLVSPHLGPRVLEIGCGIGLMLDVLTGKERLIGIDRNPALIRRARRRLTGRKEVVLRHLDALDARVRSLRRENLTGVLFANSLELMENDRRALRHAASVLGLGGKVAILTWALETPPLPLQPTYGLRGYSKRQLHVLLHDAGFHAITLHWVNLLGIAGWWLDRRHLADQPLMGPEAFRRRDLMIPLARLVDRITGPPVGRLLLATGIRR